MSVSVMIRFALSAIACSVIGSCGSPSEPAKDSPNQRILIATAVENGLRLEIYSAAKLRVGYNPVYYKVSRNGNDVANVRLQVTPMMYMGSHDHGCPSYAPSNTIDSLGMYSGAVIFTMPNDSLWFLNVDITEPDANTTTSYSVAVPVLASNNVNTMRFATSSTMFITMIPPDVWRVGMNDVSFVLHSSDDGATFYVGTNEVLTLTPTMPSMGHGSMGNRNPEHVENGRYTGAVNMIMRGEWALDLSVQSGEGAPWKTRFMIMVP